MSAQRVPMVASWVAIAAALLAVVAAFLLFSTTRPRSDPWSGTKGTIEFMCRLPPGTPITYQGQATDRDALRFSAPGHPFILVPYNPIGGYEHPIPGDIDC